MKNGGGVFGEISRFSHQNKHTQNSKFKNLKKGERERERDGSESFEVEA
jgi:hypothetical protein